MSERVCPTCGAPAGEQLFCQACGRNLRRVSRLPSREEWLVAGRPPQGAAGFDTTCGSGDPPAGQMCARPTARPVNVLFVKRVAAGPGDRIVGRVDRCRLLGMRCSPRR